MTTLPVSGGLISWDPEPPYDKPQPITNQTEIFDPVNGQWSVLRSADLPVGIMGGRLVSHNDEVYLLTGQYNGMTIYDSPKWFRAVLRLKYDSNNSEWVNVGELKLNRDAAVVLSVPQSSVQNCSLPEDNASFTLKGNVIAICLLMCLLKFIFE